MLDLLGSIRVTKARVFHSNIQYGILLQPGKLVFVKIGGQNADPRQARKLDALLDKAQSTEELLQLDKDNFQIDSTDISEVEVHKTSKNFFSPRTGYLETPAIKIKGNRNEYVEMVPDKDLADQALQKCVNLLSQALPGKIRLKQ